jgi:hypothetical protein
MRTSGWEFLDKNGQLAASHEKKPVEMKGGVNWSTSSPPATLRQDACMNEGAALALYLKISSFTGTDSNPTQYFRLRKFRQVAR